MNIQAEGSASQAQQSRYAGLSFFVLALVQGFHEMEHIVQLIQRFVLDNPRGAGILGSWVDIEPIHIAYNSAFLFMITLCYWAGGFHRGAAAHAPLAFGLMSFALLFQSYHFVEHVFKIAQFIESGMHGTPGILGHHFNLVWLHFTYNTIAYIPILVVFFIEGYWRKAYVMLSSILQIGRLRVREA